MLGVTITQELSYEIIQEREKVRELRTEVKKLENTDKELQAAKDDLLKDYQEVGSLKVLP